MIKLFFEHKYLFIFSGIVLLVLILIIYYLLKRLILNYFTKIDYKKKYDINKLQNMIELREDRERNYIYYGIDYWVWQKNKLEILESLFPVGTLLDNGKTITDVLQFSKITPRIFGNGDRETKYLRELRFIPNNISQNINSYGDNVYGDKIGGDKFENNNGVQNINITKYQVIEPLEKLLMKNELSENDKNKIKDFINNLSKDNSSESEKSGIIETLSNYIGVIGGITGIIDVLHNFRIL